MSDAIHHECGVAYVRLLRPLSYYRERYGSALYGFNQLSLLMQKQRNRGQDGVGIGCCKLGMPIGKRYLFHEKSVKREAVTRIFEGQLKRYSELVRHGVIDPETPGTVKDHFDFGGENLVGHLRYNTSGGTAMSFCHPQVRESNWATKSLLVLGNFNMTNLADLKQHMVDRGQHPFHDTDTQVILEEIGYHLDEEHVRLYREHRNNGRSGHEIASRISDDLDLFEVLKDSARNWDGGYVLVGLVGNGDGFVMRDPLGIRPCHYLANDEVIVFASERAPLMTVFGVEAEAVHEVPPGHAATIKKDGTLRIDRFAEAKELRACSFERIYFSRGNDPDIYRERKALGAKLVPQVLNSVGRDFEKTVFTFIPNTAETGYYGLMDALRMVRREEVRATLSEELRRGNLTDARIEELVLGGWPRGEKVANKDEKFRTFISKEEGRNELVSFAYDISYESVRSGDQLVALDDSIVRGTTLQQSIIKILSRCQPKKIVIVSTAPQIRYPDCYGIDMSELGKFLAFKGAVRWLEKNGRMSLLREVYEACHAELAKPAEERGNAVQMIYEPMTTQELSQEMGELVRPADVPWEGEVELIFQTIEDLHSAIPKHTGDWYFTGEYPTPGGYTVVNQAYINHYEGRDGRPYDNWN